MTTNLTIPGEPDQYQTLEDCLTMVGTLVDSLSPHLDQHSRLLLSRLSLRLTYLSRTHPHCSERRATYLLWLQTKLTQSLKGAQHPERSLHL